jgi:hypothetical protein
MQYSVYSSPEELVKACNTKPDLKGVGYDASYEWKNITDGEEFYGGSTAHMTKEFYKEHSYEAKLTANIEDQFDTEKFYKKRFKFQTRQTVGCRVDIPRLLNNDPRYWFSVKKIVAENRAVRVFAPMGGLGDVTESELRVCGATTCAVVEALEANNIAVELWASCCSHSVFRVGISYNGVKDGTENDICQLIKLKDSSQYSDLGMINFVTGHHGFYRNFVFKDRILTALKLDNANVDISFLGMGSSYNFPKEYIPQDEDHDASKDIVIPRIYELSRAKKWAEEKLPKIINNINNQGVLNESEAETELE